MTGLIIDQPEIGGPEGVEARRAVLALADRFLTAVETGDGDGMRAAYAPDAVIWHNGDGLEHREQGQSPEHNIRVMHWMRRILTDIRYTLIHRETTQRGFVQQHILTGTLPDGSALVMPAMVVCQVENGRITRLDEYFDPTIPAVLNRFA